jgi:predicted aminopeptidase
MFNESLAEFVGAHGAIAFMCSRLGEESQGCARAKADWHDEMVFGAFLDSLVQRLDSVYTDSALTREEKLSRREVIFAQARRDFVNEVQPRFVAATYAGFLNAPINNATLISRRLYYHRLDLFERVFQSTGGDLRRTIDLILDAARGDKADPYGGVERMVHGSQFTVHD